MQQTRTKNVFFYMPYRCLYFGFWKFYMSENKIFICHEQKKKNVHNLLTHISLASDF